MAIVAVILKLVLVPIMGVEGAIWATVIAYVCLIVIPDAIFVPRSSVAWHPTPRTLQSSSSEIIGLDGASPSLDKRSEAVGQRDARDSSPVARVPERPGDRSRHRPIRQSAPAHRDWTLSNPSQFIGHASRGVISRSRRQHPPAASTFEVDSPQQTGDNIINMHEVEFGVPGSCIKRLAGGESIHEQRHDRSWRLPSSVHPGKDDGACLQIRCVFVEAEYFTKCPLRRSVERQAAETVGSAVLPHRSGIDEYRSRCRDRHSGNEPRREPDIRLNHGVDLLKARLRIKPPA